MLQQEHQRIECVLSDTCQQKILKGELSVSALFDSLNAIYLSNLRDQVSAGRY